MLKSINTVYFSDGYSLNEVPCDTLTIAHALGILNQTLYYHYCALDALDRLSNNSITRCNLLDILGVEEKNAFDENYTSTKEFLKLGISIGSPVLLHTNYNCIYYSDGYKKKNQNNHIILLTGYDSDTDIVQIQDYEIICWYNTNFTKGQIFYCSRVPYSLIDEIIQNTKVYFSLDETNFYKKHLILYQSNNLKRINSVDVLSLLLQIRNDLLNILTEKICTYQIIIPEESEKYFHYFRIRFFGAFKVIFSFISTRFSISEEIKRLISEFLYNLEILIAIWQKDTMKKGEVDKEKMLNLIGKLNKNLDDLCDKLVDCQS